MFDIGPILGAWSKIGPHVAPTCGARLGVAMAQGVVGDLQWAVYLSSNASVRLASRPLPVNNML